MNTTNIDTNIDTSTIDKNKKDINIVLEDPIKDILPVINKNNIKKVLSFCLLLITILLQIVIKTWTFILLFNYYNILKINNIIQYDEYKYIFYLALANLFFTIITIIYSLIAFYIFIYKYPIFNKYKTKIEISIIIMWVISSILSIISSIIRMQIINKYNKYLNNNCDINEKIYNIILIISFVFFCLSLIINFSKF
jgi:hypothetical protein